VSWHVSWTEFLEANKEQVLLLGFVAFSWLNLHKVIDMTSSYPYPHSFLVILDFDFAYAPLRELNARKNYIASPIFLDNGFIILLLVIFCLCTPYYSCFLMFVSVTWTLAYIFRINGLKYTEMNNWAVSKNVNFLYLLFETLK